MPVQQFNAWAGFWRASPWGEFRSDMRSGIIAATVANCHKDPKRKAFSAADFMPFMETQPISDEQIEKKIEHFMRRYH